MNKHSLSLFIFSVFICCSASTSAAADWVLFFQSETSSDLQFELYYDQDSITRTDNGTVLVWYKNVPQEDSEIKPWLESLELREIDCYRKRYQTLQGHWLFADRPLKTKNKSPLTYFNTSALDTAYFSAACKPDE